MPNRRNKPYRPRPTGYNRLLNWSSQLNGIARGFADLLKPAREVEPQDLADINLVFQQVAKVHEYAALSEPPRADVLRAHNLLARLNDSAELTNDEISTIRDTLQRTLNACYRLPRSTWESATTTAQIAQHQPGRTNEVGWFGGALKPHTGV